MEKLYKVIRDCWYNQVATANSHEGFLQARQDKLDDPSLPFTKLEFISKHGGVTVGALMWNGERWQ